MQQREAELPNSLSAVLKSTALRFNELEEAADKACTEKDLPASIGFHEEKTHLIADLPDSLTSLAERGIHVPEGIELWARDYSRIARELLAKRSNLGMSLLLNPQGSKIGDPNELERLIFKVEFSRKS